MKHDLKAKVFSARIQTGLQGNIVEEFFDSIIKNLSEDEKAECLFERLSYKRTDNGASVDNYLHTLIFNDQLVASVIERRTDLNDLEFTFLNLSYKATKLMKELENAKHRKQNNQS